MRDDDDEDIEKYSYYHPTAVGSAGASRRPADEYLRGVSRRPATIRVNPARHDQG